MFHDCYSNIKIHLLQICLNIKNKLVTPVLCDLTRECLKRRLHKTGGQLIQVKFIRNVL
jgi:hypothetical protein